MKNKISTIILTIVLFSVVAFFSIDIFSNISIFNYDDLNSTLDSYPLWKEENGRYICNFLSRVFCVYIPNLFGIHLQNWANTGGAVLYFLILILLFISGAKFWFLKQKNGLFFPLLLCIPILEFGVYINSSDVHYWQIYSYQYGYVLATVFGLTFLYKIYNYILNKKEPISKKDIVLTSIIALCAGNSCQIVCYSIFITIFLLFITFLLFNIKNIYKIKKCILNKNVLIPFLCFLFGFISMVACPGFWKEVSWRHADSFSQIISIYPDFMKCVREVLIYRELHEWCVVFFLLIAIWTVASLKNDLKQRFVESISVLFPVVGVACYFLTLILAGPTFPSAELKYWLYEPYYDFYYRMVISVEIIMLLGILCDLVKNNILKLIIILLSIYEIFIVYPNLKDVFKSGVIKTRETRQLTYQCDKFLYQQYKSNPEEEIILPKSCEKINVLCASRYLKAVYNIENANVFVRYLDDDVVINELNGKGITVDEDELAKTIFKK